MSTTIRITARRDEAPAAEQRGVLLRRIVVAGVLIALLIGGLAVFDASRRSHDDEDDEAPAQAAVPTLPAPAAVSAVPPEETPAVSALPAALEDSPPPLPEGDAAEAAATPSASTTAEPAGTGAAKVLPHAQSAKVPAAAAEPAVPEATARPGAPVAVSEGADARRSSADRAARAEPSAPPALTRSPAGGYVVQAGVFSHTANAEELRAKLALHGIPAQVETRVLVGPFRTRAEADRARAQMRALGLEGAPPVAR
jgi:cell division protein FtsN